MSHPKRLTGKQRGNSDAANAHNDEHHVHNPDAANAHNDDHNVHVAASSLNKWIGNPSPHLVTDYAGTEQLHTHANNTPSR